MADEAGAFAPRDAATDRRVVDSVEREAARQMRKLRVTSPTGKTFEIEAPADASDHDIAAFVETYMPKIEGGTPPQTVPQFTPWGAGEEQKLPPKPQEQPAGAVVDAGKAFGAGVVRGGLGLLGLPGTVETLGRAGINFAGRQFGAGGNVVNPKSVFPTGGDYQNDLESVTGPLYKPKTTAGKYAQTAGEFVPGLMFPAGRAASLAERAIYNVAAPAVASETAGQLTKGTSAEPYARIAGAILGGQLPQAAGRVVSPLNIDPTRARMGQALEQEGVGLTAGDRTGSRFVRWMESNAADTPFSGNRAQAIKEAQGEQFTRAALQRAGIHANRATPEVIDQGFRRLGQEFEQMARMSRFVVPNGAMRWVDQAVQQYERVTPPQFLNPAPRAIAEDMRKLLNNAANPAGRSGQQRAKIPGDVFQKWMSDLGAAARGTQDPSTRRLVGDIRNILDDAAERSMRAINPDLAQQYRVARTQYRNLLAIERAATGAGENAALGDRKSTRLNSSH